MQCLYETRVSNTEWRKSLVRGLSFFLSEIGQVTLKVEPGCVQILLSFREVWQLWRLSGKTALHYCADNLAPICPSLLLAAQVLANTKTKRHIRKNTICHRSDELYNDTKTASRASLKQRTLRGTLAFTLPSYPATGSRVYLGKPSCKKSAVFFNIVQKAFDPPPLLFEHHVVNIMYPFYPQISP